MSDDKKDKQDAPKPLKDPKVDVTVEPRTGKPADKQVAEKHRDTLQKRVEGSIKEAAPGGAQKQLEAADRETDEAGRGIDRRQVKEIKVVVKGKDGNAEVTHERKIKPREEK